MGSRRRRNRKRKHNNLSKCKVLPPELDFPPELLTEVLARLPAKTLVRFRSVCRDWCSMIDKPDFLSMHLSLYKNNADKNRLLVMDNSKGYSTLQVLSRDKFMITTTLRQKLSGKLEVLGYCNGLVVLFLNCGMYYRIKLWNPSIQKSIVLPGCPGVKQINPPIIGFVPSSNDYKVAAFRFSIKNLSVSISIYSVSDHLWRNKTVMIDFPVIFIQMIGYGEIYYGNYYSFDEWKIYYSHGAVHWLVSDKKEPNKQSDEFEPEPTHVLSFDFGVEGFYYVKLPVVEDETVMHVFNLGESLAIFGVSKQSTCIWVMTENLNNNPWSLWFSGDSNLDAYELFSTKCPTTRLYKKLFFDENTSTFIVVCNEFIVVCNEYEEPMSYNIITRQIRRVRESTADLRINFVDTYVESLALCRRR